jgi:polysaccharide export outer membrane protein
VAGLPTAQLGALLTEKYRAFIRNAQVTVAVKEIKSQRIYIIGEVKKEGAIQLDGPLTVLQALAEAGGLSDYAKRKKIYVLRGSQGQTRQSFGFNFDEVVRGNRMEQNILLLPGDTVVVPR